MVSKDLAKEISKQNTERSTCFPFATYDDMYSEKGELKKIIQFSAKFGGTIKRQDLLGLKINLFFIPDCFREQKSQNKSEFQGKKCRYRQKGLVHKKRSM